MSIGMSSIHSLARLALLDDALYGYLGKIWYLVVSIALHIAVKTQAPTSVAESCAFSL